jgi:eukaryotic-like serine/threonine-protein kinase
VTPEQWQAIKEVLHAAWEHEPDERATFLDDACRGNSALRRQVESLLAAGPNSLSNIQDPLAGDATDLLAVRDRTEPDPSKHPERIGPYKILDVLGEGGMGIVYLAEQHDPVRRRVAVKIIKAGMDTRPVVARFESERQALAVMDHPAIAKVFDAGITAEGRPYFVMEHVRGLPITHYCNINRLSTSERLRLFVDVCNAVQHAHQKSVVHRDLKPSNVLVATLEQQPVPKVIDFGIAKAIGSTRLTDRTLVTRLGQMIGTPQYMSPEQAQMSGMDIDTRTDIYALGVMLFELLTSCLPFDLSGIPDFAIVHVIRERDAPRPSARLAALPTPAQQAVATLRNTDVRTLARELRGDLDWVVLKAIDKDRTRRYAAANDLAQDLERYLANEPVLARPPSSSYRLRKLVRRNRRAVVTASVAVLGLLGGLFGATYGVITSNQSEAVALREAATARRVTEFLVNLFRDSRIDSVDLSARELLDRGAVDLEQTSWAETDVQARLLLTIGAIYYDLGFIDQAKRLMQRSLEIRVQQYGYRHPAVADALMRLGRLLSSQDDYAEATIYLNEASDILATTDDPYSLDVTIQYVLAEVASRYMENERYAEARQFLEQALAHAEGYAEPDSPLRAMFVVTSLQRLARLHSHLESYDTAKALLQRAVRLTGNAENEAISQREVDCDLCIATILDEIARIYFIQEKFDSAAVVYGRLLTMKERVLGPNHASLSQTLTALAGALEGSGRLIEANAAHARARSIRAVSN